MDPDNIYLDEQMDEQIDEQPKNRTSSPTLWDGKRNKREQMSYKNETKMRQKTSSDAAATNICSVCMHTQNKLNNTHNYHLVNRHS